MITAIQKEAGPGALTPDQFILTAINHWGRYDVFFRAFDPVVLPSLTSGDRSSEFVIFKQEGTDHYFGIPISGTILLERLGIYGKPNFAGYGTDIAAIVMLRLHAQGFEFFGIMAAPIARMENGGPAADPKRYTIKEARLGDILKTPAYIGYKMTDEFKGATLLIPESLLVPKAFQGEAENV
jgi:hypothetical protein